MASLIDLLRTRESFDQVVKSLSTRVDIEDLENDLAGIQGLVDHAIQGGWIKRHLPGEENEENIETISPITIFVLLVTYSWVYAFEKNNSASKANRYLLVVLGKYIWPLYQIFVLPDSGKIPSNISNEQVKNWLMDSQNLQSVIEELNLKIPPEVIGYAKIEAHKDSATISRWLGEGLSRLHNEMCTILDIEPVDSGSTKKGFVVSDAQGLGQIIPGDQEIPLWQHPLDQIEKRAVILQSPISGYFAPIDILVTFDDLWHQQKRIPTLKEIAEFYVGQHLGAANLNNDQRLLAKQLLYHITDWSLAGTRLSHSIARGEIENRWKQFYSESLSPLINELLEQGLLEQDGVRLRIKAPLVFDYFLTRRQFESPIIYPLPPTDDIQLSCWIYWLLQEYSDKHEPDKAGAALWQYQGYLPGSCSGSWDRITSILELLPESLLGEPYIWILATIAVYIRKCTKIDDDESLTPADRLSRSLPDHPVRLIKEANDCVNEYKSGMDDFLAQAIDQDASVALAVSINLFVTRKKWLVKKHALSSLRHVSPDLSLAYRVLSVTIGKKSLRDNLIEQLRKASSEEEMLAIAEPLIGWGVSEADQYIRGSGYSEKEDHSRSWILKNAAKGSPGFMSWV